MKKLRTPKLEPPSVKPPKVLMDLYRDLRDRRLLIVVGALVIAIVAIPFALAKKPQPVAPAAAPSTASKPSQQTVPAVTLADVPGATNYRQRLARFETKNPFKAQFAVKASTAGGSGTGAGAGANTAPPFPIGGSSGTASGGSTPTTSPLPPGGSTSPQPQPQPNPPTTTPPTTTTPTPPTGGGNGTGQNKPTIKTVTRLFTRRIDLSIAKVGGPSRDMSSVAPMTILPNATNPALAFLGTDENGKNAAFVLSSLSTATGGNASCVPAPDNCIYVTMQAGDTLTVDYTPTGQTVPVSYKVTLTKIRDINVSGPSSKATPPAPVGPHASVGQSGGWLEAHQRTRPAR